MDAGLILSVHVLERFDEFFLLGRVIFYRVVEAEKEAVTFAPSFTKKMQNQEAIVGETAKFTVKVMGEPTPTVKW